MRIYRQHDPAWLIGNFDIAPGADFRFFECFWNANLARTNLSRSNFANVYLEDANLADVNLSGANLKSASLRDSDLSGANLQMANLVNSDLSGCDLSGANFFGAKLIGTSLTGATLPKFQLPDGDLFAYKKVTSLDGQGHGDAIAKLKIPARAKRTASLIGGKCRAEAALVESIYLTRTGEEIDKAISLHDVGFAYEVGKMAYPTQMFDDDIRIECTAGIHFFLSEKDAVDYNFSPRRTVV